ncbi:hypothetical protein HKCCE2091_03715 [Rhodobacterales bacterium HKCCE2091]|nr:hypothetical protein [Rhodobacterales bacterium HKCCE2091]
MQPMLREPTEIATGEPLELGHRAEIEPLLARSAAGPSTSERSFANLFLFRRAHGYRFLRDPVPGLLGATYDGRAHAMPLCPLDEALPLLDFAEFLYPVDEATLAQGSRGWRRRHEDADSDYLYDTAALARLPSDRRAQAERFETGQAPSIEIDPVGFEVEALAVLERWEVEVGKPAAHTDADECREAISLGNEIGLQAVLVRAGDVGAACGFLLASDLPDGSRAVHFAKATRSLPGVYPWMFSRYARMSGCRVLNFEQDLGMEGLRRAKLALGPSGRLVKYRLTPA